jgi:hypothetical protein
VRNGVLSPFDLVEPQTPIPSSTTEFGRKSWKIHVKRVVWAAGEGAISVHLVHRTSAEL